MSKERELLGRVLEGDHGGDFFITNRLLKEIQTLLTQPEQNNTQYLVEGVSRLRAENAMLKEKWSTPKREPIDTRRITLKMFSEGVDMQYKNGYVGGIKYAEKAHGITGAEINETL